MGGVTVLVMVRGRGIEPARAAANGRGGYKAIACGVRSQALGATPFCLNQASMRFQPSSAASLR